MANQEHLAELMKGVSAWNEWRENNSSVVPNFREADLVKVNLSAADLRGVHLGHASLIGADLTGAILDRADLFSADLTGANLVGTNLSGANLIGAILGSANLTGADFSRTIISDTIFTNIDSRDIKGLDTCIHEGPSSIGIDTIYQSKGDVPEAFLRGAGVPE